MVLSLNFQAESQATPDVLPEVWGQNGLIPGGIPGGAGCFAWSFFSSKITAVCQAIAGLLAGNMTQNIDIHGCLSGYSRIFSLTFVYERQNERQCRWFCRSSAPHPHTNKGRASHMRECPSNSYHKDTSLRGLVAVMSPARSNHQKPREPKCGYFLMSALHVAGLNSCTSGSRRLSTSILKTELKLLVAII